MTQRRHVQEKHKIDYGQDAPRLLQRYFLWGGVLAILGGLLTHRFSQRTSYLQRLCFLLGWVVQLVGMASLFRALVMIWSSRISKVQAAHHLLNELELQGHEMILDLGCGRGLLLLEAARRLPMGKAIGIDLWSNEDQGNNSRQATLDNAQELGVAERVEVHDGDMCDLSFLPDGSIDVVIASKAIHNIADQKGRYRAIEEATRVLKPGGRIVIMDIFFIDEFAQSLQTCGIQEIHVSTLLYPAYPLLRTVTGTKNSERPGSLGCLRMKAQ